MLICFNLLQNNLFGRRFFLLLVDSCQGSKEVDQHFVNEDDLVSDDRHDPHALQVHVLAVVKGETTLFFCLIVIINFSLLVLLASSLLHSLYLQHPNRLMRSSSLWLNPKSAIFFFSREMFTSLQKRDLSTLMTRLVFQTVFPSS